jgi:DNA-nicking Smr family endonuclease
VAHDEEALMDILFLVSQIESAPLLRGFLRACERRQIECGCFFTGPAAQLAGDPKVMAFLQAGLRSAVCEYSWERFGHGQCLIPLGSQTDNSAMAAAARHIVSL